MKKPAECQSKTVSVLDSTMHYLEQGEGNPIIFLHGIPTSSHLWRKILPEMAQYGRCIAPDLIGMGASGKPDIPYRIFDHVEYIEAFIKKLDLSNNITLVMHGWGSVIGFDYASRNERRISGLAFYESHIRPVRSWDMLSLPIQHLAKSFKDNKQSSYDAIVEQNALIEQIMPSGILTELAESDWALYRNPFLSKADRQPLWQYMQDLPLGDNEPADVVSFIQAYSEWLQKTNLPKLMLYAIPGFATTMDTVIWAKDSLKNVQLSPLNDALHFAQETLPVVFAENLSGWYKDNCLVNHPVA